MFLVDLPSNRPNATDWRVLLELLQRPCLRPTQLDAPAPLPLSELSRECAETPPVAVRVGPWLAVCAEKTRAGRRVLRKCKTNPIVPANGKSLVVQVFQEHVWCFSESQRGKCLEAPDVAAWPCGKHDNIDPVPLLQLLTAWQLPRLHLP